MMTITSTILKTVGLVFGAVLVLLEYLGVDGRQRESDFIHFGFFILSLLCAVFILSPIGNFPKRTLVRALLYAPLSILFFLLALASLNS